MKDFIAEYRASESLRKACRFRAMLHRQRVSFLWSH